jgi:hypothetical protein
VWQSTNPGAIVQPSNHPGSTFLSPSAGPTYVMTPSSQAIACSADSVGRGPLPRTTAWSADGVTRLVAAIAPLLWSGTTS